MTTSTTAKEELFVENHTPRAQVHQAYHLLLADQASNPDKIFNSGHTLCALDTNFVSLDSDHPRVGSTSPYAPCITFHLIPPLQSWPTATKVRATAILASFSFLSPFASTIFAPSLHLVMADFNITDTTTGALQVSIFLFALALGPLFLAPLSERYGRGVVLHGGNVVFVGFSVGGGFAGTVSTMLIGGAVSDGRKSADELFRRRSLRCVGLWLVWVVRRPFRLRVAFWRIFGVWRLGLRRLGLLCWDRKLVLLLEVSGIRTNGMEVSLGRFLAQCVEAGRLLDTVHKNTGLNGDL